MFRLSKWYLDLVTDHGAVLILYAARLRWAHVGLHYASVLHIEDGAVACDRTTFRRVDRPLLESDLLTWSCDRLGVEGEWRRDADPLDCTLADGPAGMIRWSCHMPRARAQVRIGQRELCGFGYAESLCVTIRPSRLPFHELRWGRHLSPEHAAVWIEWDEAPETHWAWIDGVRTPDFSRARDLRFTDSRNVRNRRIVGLHEHKQVSRSAIVRDGRPIDAGWAIHEVVQR